MRLTLKNYRCFGQAKPASFEIRDGFTSFLGPNNSGKSTILRFFFEFRSLLEQLNENNGTIFNALQGQPFGFNLPQNITDPESVYCNQNNHSLSIELNYRPEHEKYEEGGHHVIVPERLILTCPYGQRACSAEVYFQGDRVPGHTDGHSKGLFRVKPNTSADLRPFLRCLTSLANSLYIGSFRNALNLGEAQNYFDITTGQAFIRQWHELKSGNNRRKNEASFRLLRDLESIFGFSGLDINPSPDGTTLQVFINNKSYSLAEVGSGFAQFFIVLANVATARPAFALIDEPEISLHPALQLEFLTTVGAYAERGVMFATHSIGLARSASERIYSVSVGPEGGRDVSLFEKHPTLSEFLGELSYSGHRELGFSKVLLVEGPTEIRTIQQLLRLLRKDHQVLLLHLEFTATNRSQSIDAEILIVRLTFADATGATVHTEDVRATAKPRYPAWSDSQVTPCRSN